MGRTPEETTRAIQDLAGAAAPAIVAWRRAFHRIPEVGLTEFRTTEALCAELARMDVPFTRPLPTGCVATLAGTAPDAYEADGAPRRRLLLRADIDALPVAERTGAPFASENEGVMHACGHDCHIAMMLGALEVLRQLTDELHGEVRAVFQPAEETAQGAEAMIEAGVLEGVDGVFGMHIWSEVDAGTISIEPGPRMANVDWFRIDVAGTGSHGAMPERGADAIVAAARIVDALQSVVSRDLSPLESAVLTVGELHGGTARNVIADAAWLTGTVRTYGAAARAQMPRLIERVASHTAEVHGCTAALTEYEHGNPAVVNDPASAARGRAALLKVLGPEAEARYRGTMSGEDFSEYLARVPGAFAFVGTRNPALGAVHPQHSCRYTVDESVLTKGAMLAAQYAVDFLAEGAGTPNMEES